MLIGVYSQGSVDDAENSMRELAALAETAGAAVLDGLLQRRPTPDPSTYFGRGKAEELRALVAAVGADTVIADTELAPSQRRALEDVVKVKVIDRTAVILDIFSQHAKSREGKAQVELAQLQYLLPRLRGWGDSMSRQAGGQVGGAGAGMGSRGPGETKIELDRRRINTRMARLRKQIAAMKPARDTKRANRDRNSVPSVAIVGYTNAGKSSLLNRVTKAGVLVENALFATLDATVRKTETDQGQLYTLADTVGFVRNLPHQLVEAFRSTLEELADSDVLVHVVDASHRIPRRSSRPCTRSSRRWTPRPSRRSWCSTRATSPPTATASSCAASRPRASSSRPARARGSRSCVAGSQSCCRSRPSRWTSWCPSSTARSSRCSTTGRRSSRPPTSRRARACARS
ncbi:GTPase HflX [Clavibacter michiganensis subsp. michiganensis]|uniref:GTPase HflX n=1 Tax=Clavibacter michiganensis subsp. michiganensis TaxID=33013 RepID=A0A251XGW2_CLAMM|nr:GTPase HflX [Clavibacter michiganensis subsp. michiganensis]OUE02397.1 GTPase HflX [Clavibacter michiganensis subsp. michiganensis]